MAQFHSVLLMLKITSKHKQNCLSRPVIYSFIHFLFYSNSSTHPVMRRLQLFWMIPTCWKRRNAWKKSGGCLKNRGKILKWKGEISQRLPSDWAMRFWLVIDFYGPLNSVLNSSWFEPYCFVLSEEVFWGRSCDVAQTSVSEHNICRPDETTKSYDWRVFKAWVILLTSLISR